MTLYSTAGCNGYADPNIWDHEVLLRKPENFSL